MAPATCFPSGSQLAALVRGLRLVAEALVRAGATAVAKRSRGPTAPAPERPLTSVRPRGCARRGGYRAATPSCWTSSTVVQRSQRPLRARLAQLDRRAPGPPIDARRSTLDAGNAPYGCRVFLCPQSFLGGLVCWRTDSSPRAAAMTEVVCLLPLVVLLRVQQLLRTRGARGPRLCVLVEDVAPRVAIGLDHRLFRLPAADSYLYSLAHILVICCAFWLATTPPSTARLAEAASVRSTGRTCTGAGGMGDVAGFVSLFIVRSPYCLRDQPIRCAVVRREQPVSPESHGTTCNQVLMVISGVCGVRPAKGPPGPKIPNGPPGPCAARMPSQLR